MKISKYFETAVGRGVLATVDANCRIDISPFARPHVVDEETVAFLVTDRTSYQNLQVNPHATYVFLEEGPEYNGRRLFLTKIREEEEGELTELLRRKTHPESKDRNEIIVYFRVDEFLPLITLEERKEASARA